jgi:putative ABC transport system ATP-binding protein
VISLKKVNKSYRTGTHSLHVLKDVDLEIGQGEMVSIMGSSGSGKSTLLNIVGILDSYDSGDYHLNGTLVKNLTERKAAQFRNRTIGFVFQSFNLVGFKNAMENVALPLYYQNISRKKRNKIALEYLDKVGLKDWATHHPNELSGGQKQRVAIARALVTQPKLILADEPTGALDSKTSNEVMNLLQVINQDDITLVIVTHEHDIAQKTSRSIQLVDGQIDSDKILSHV